MIAALYVQEAGVYARLPAVDLWGPSRDARRYAGPHPVVAHPPCRAWGKFAAMSKHPPEEPNLAFHALESVERYGGVLEHPVGSSFFDAAGIPPSRLIRVDQCDFGHRARKATWLYVVGGTLPPFPPPGNPDGFVENMCRAEREATPYAFAQWLCQLAESCRQPDL